jgi:biotin operon repressor
LVGCVISEGINWGRNPKYLHLKGRTWQTQEQLATEIGISERQVRRCIEQLEARGWIATEQRALGRATTTRLMWPRFPFDRTPVSGGRKIKTRTQRAVTGQFMQASLDAEVRCDRTPVTGHHLEDHLDNYLDGAASRGLLALPGVSEDMLREYREAKASGSRARISAAMRRIEAERRSATDIRGLPGHSDLT